MLKDNGIIYGLGAAAVLAGVGVAMKRGSSARGSSARQEWVPKDLAAVPSGYPTSIPFDKAHMSMWHSYEPGSKLARDNPGIYSTFLPDGTQNYMGGRGITYVLRDVSKGSRSSASGHTWIPSGGAASRRWSWTGAVDGDTVDVIVMPGTSAFVPYVVVREHDLSLPHTSGLNAAQRIAKDAYLTQLATLNKLARQGSKASSRSSKKVHEFRVGNERVTKQGEPPLKFLVRVIEQGGRYGRDDVLTHNERDPMIEFWLISSGENPWFVSRYYMTTLDESEQDGRGILLEGSMPWCVVDAAAVTKVMERAKKIVGDWKPDKRWATPSRSLSRGFKSRGSRGRRYEAAEWVDFFAGSKARKSTKKLGERFDNAVWPVFLSWLASPQGRKTGLAPDDFDHNDVAYHTYASLAGHGIGLWDGELFHEQGVARGQSYDYGKQLDEWMKTKFYTDKNSKLINKLHMEISIDEMR